MPQIRYYHHGRYYRPARPMPLLPPLSLVPSVDPSKHAQLRLGGPSEEDAVARRWKTQRDREFRWMVRYISDNLTGENIADMRFLCRDHVHPPELLRQTMKGATLMSILERHRLLAENSLFFLQTLLYYAARPDLYELVLEFRTKRQNDIRKIGVMITHEVDSPSVKGLTLSKDLKSFRKGLKPRSRFNTVDIQAMTKRLADLKARMQSQLPKTFDQSYAESILSSSVSQNSVSDSEWEDVDDDDSDVDESNHGNFSDQSQKNRTSDGGRDGLRGREGIGNASTTERGNDSRAKREVTEADHKSDARLPAKERVKISVKIKTGREGESDYEDNIDEDETKREGKNEMENWSETVTTTTAANVIQRIQGPSKPVDNFTHRSIEFSDMMVNGKQTYNDDDVIACVRDVNKSKSIASSTSVRHHEREHNETLLPSIIAQQHEAKRTKATPKVPLKIRTMRRKYLRHNSPGKTARVAIKRQRVAKSLPLMPPPAPQANDFVQLKTTHSIPTHDPQRMNFLPDIYDKYARKSVSTATTTKSTNSRFSQKSKKR